ncbi:hypothetical protein ACWDRX_37825, partial [Streptomyces nigra]
LGMSVSYFAFVLALSMSETDTTRATSPGAEAWWDVPVAEVAGREAAVEARERYDRQVTARRHHL